MSDMLRLTSASSAQIRFPEKPASTRIRVVGVETSPQFPELEDPSIRKDGGFSPPEFRLGIRISEGCVVWSDMEIDKKGQKMREIGIGFLIVFRKVALERTDLSFAGYSCE